jgi:hypothetical protein
VAAVAGSHELVKAQSAATAMGPIVYENMTTVRYNHDSPALPIVRPYTTGVSAGPDQTGSMGNGVYTLIVPSGNRPYIDLNGAYPYTLADAWVKGRLEAGTWDANANRMYIWMKTTARITRKPGGDQTAEIGTYVKAAPDGSATNQGDHYYHYLCADWYPNQWMLIVLNRQVQHMVGQNAGTNWPEDPSWNSNLSAQHVHYYDGLTSFYFTDEYGDPAMWGNATYQFAPITLGTVSGEPDSLVSSITATYTGIDYELTWAAPKNVTTQYTVYYSTKGSMHLNGLASGTKSTTVSSPGSAYTGTGWASPAMPQAAGIWFAIQPVGQSSFTEVFLPSSPTTVVAPSTSQPPAAPILRIVP